MTVAALCLSASKSAPMQVVAEIEVVAGAGIVGDRYFRRARHPGQNITLIEAEEIDAFNARTGTSLAATDARRNIITRGVRLNSLVGVTFRIGGVTLRGVELCEPCRVLSGYIAGPGMRKKDFIRELTHRCGLRADAVTSGMLRTGDPIEIGGNGDGSILSLRELPVRQDST